jgi:mevalonate kinase
MLTDHQFYGRGKLMITGEYFVLDGATALACPTTVGQKMQVKYRKSYNPSLKWESYDPTGKKWFDAEFEFWRFEILKGQTDPNVSILKNILIQARKQNPHFLRDDFDIEVKTYLEFPVDWGLGSSSSLLYNIAQWAYISPFELLDKTMDGSGYDVACAQSNGPILYKLNNQNLPTWQEANFNPCFKDQLFLIYLGRKQSTQSGIERYRGLTKPSRELIKTITRLTKACLSSDNLEEFEAILSEHEEIVSNYLRLATVKKERFADFWGCVKSMGAWGGDFALVTSNRSVDETRAYFLERGIDVFIPYHEIIYQSQANSLKDEN